MPKLYEQAAYQDQLGKSMPKGTLKNREETVSLATTSKHHNPPFAEGTYEDAIGGRLKEVCSSEFSYSSGKLVDGPENNQPLPLTHCKQAMFPRRGGTPHVLVREEIPP